MPVLADVAHGALAPGVNAATLLVFNAAAGGAALALAALLATPAGQAVWPHVAAALAVNVGLAVGVNWVVAASGGLTTDCADMSVRRLLTTGVGHLAERRPATRTVAVALSGGVDSAVAASILAADPSVSDVICLHAHVWDADDERGAADDAAATGAPAECAAAADAAAAARAAAVLGLPLTTVDAVAPYWTDVFAPFVAGYAGGATPNPDLGCNRSIKFGHLLTAARAAGADALATGHYARLAPGPGGRPRLLRGADPAKDQSYFLAGVPGAALAAAEFPVGAMTKRDVRAAAAATPGLAFLLSRRSSAGICFVGRRRFGAFMAGYAAPVPGRWAALREAAQGGGALPHTPAAWTGADAGACPDVLAVTLGQRARIGGAAEALFVAGKDVAGARVLVVPGRAHPALFTRGAALAAASWVAGEPPSELDGDTGAALQFKARYRAPLRWARVSSRVDPAFHPTALVRLASPPPPAEVTIAFDAPVRAVTPGQAVALYRGEECLGAAAVAAPAQTLHERGEGVPAAVAAAVDADAEAGWA